MSQIRINKTPEIKEVLAYLKDKYRLLSEAEIIKIALAEKYKKELEDIPMVDKKTEKIIGEGLKAYKAGKYTVLKSDEDIDKHFDSL